jgi:NTE family protein
MFNPLKYLRNRKVGLVLGSGGSKGLSHISVIEYLESLGIPIHFIAGSSIGSVIGALYLAGTLGKYKEELMKMQWRDFLALVDPVFPRSGLLEGRKLMEFLAGFIPRSLKLEDLRIPLWVLATDYFTGDTVTFKTGPVLDAIRASISIPGVFTPVRYGETLLIDGGVANPLPIDAVQNMGAGITIAVNLHPTVYTGRLKKMLNSIKKNSMVGGTDKIEIVAEEQPEDVQADKDKPGQKWYKSLEQWIGLEKKESEKKGKKDKLPSIFQTIFRTIDIMEYMNTLLMLKYYKPTVLIQPDLTDLQTMDFTQVPKAITEGFMACGRVRGQLIRRVKYWT